MKNQMVTSPVTKKIEQSPMAPTAKWCPMARLAMVSHGPKTNANRFPGGVAYADDWRAVRCLGEACAVFIGTDTAGHCGLRVG